MRPWYIGSVAILSLAAASVIIPRFFSASNAQEATEPRGAKPQAEVAGNPQQQAPKIGKSRIDKVTVYPTNALITREVEVPDGNGLIELVVQPMPEQIVPSTLYSEGAEGLRVLTTRFSTHQVLEDTSEARRKLEAEKETLQVVSAKLASDVGGLMQNMQLLTKLESIAEKGKHTGDEVIAMTKYVMEQRDLKAREMVALQELQRKNNQKIEFVDRKLAEVGGGSGRMEREAVIVVDRENGKGGKVRLNYLVAAVTWRPEYKLRAGKANEDVQLDYLANLRQSSGEEWGHVKLTLSTAQPMLSASPPELCMLEPILVRRGQPGAPPMPTAAMPDGFNAYSSSFSTKDIEEKARQGRAQASALNSLSNSGGGYSQSLVMPQNALPPMPSQPGFGTPPGIAISQVPPPPGAFVPFSGNVMPPTPPAQALMGIGQNFVPQQALIQKQADTLLNESAALEQNLDLQRTREEVLAQARQRKKIQDVDPSRTDGPSVTYHLPNRLSVPSRNDEQVVEIAKVNLTPKFYYKAVPVLNRHVYRLADLVNKSKLELLPGEATMYQGTDFVGRMPMPLVAIGEEFTAGFGVDTQLQIQRQMVDQTRSTQGGNQVLKYEYRILINSFKNESVQLQLWDRLPKAEAEAVNINLLKSTPELCKDGIYLRESRPNNLLRWDMEVPANCNGEKAVPVTYEFRMELDRQMAITGFQSR